MLKIGFRTLEDDVEFFAETGRGMKVSGRGRQGLIDVVSAIVFWQVQEFLRKHFEEIQEIWNGSLPSGYTIEGHVGELGFESASLFVTADPSNNDRFWSVEEAVEYLAHTPQPRKPI